MKKWRTATVLTMTAMTLFAGTTTAFAADAGTSYGYQLGQQQNRDRHAQFEEVAGLSTDEERKAFFVERGIGGDGPYSGSQHLDVEELVAAGVIDEETADRIAETASAKHDRIHTGYGGKSDMTPEELHAFYENVRADGSAGDSISELLDQGLITQEQADAIHAFLAD